MIRRHVVFFSQDRTPRASRSLRRTGGFQVGSRILALGGYGEGRDLCQMEELDRETQEWVRGPGPLVFGCAARFIRMTMRLRHF